MDAATRVKLTGALFTAVLPVAAVAITLLVGRKVRPGVEARPHLGGLALVVGLTVAFVGVAGAPQFPPRDAHFWVLPAVWAAAVGGAVVDRLRLRAPGWAVGVLALGVLGVFMWRLLAPLAGVWGDNGPLDELAASAWVLDAGAALLVGWLAFDAGARSAPTPVALGPLALAFAASAGAIGLSGSALVAQLLGALGIVVGVVGLAGWRWPDIRPTHAGVGASVTAFGLLLLYGHFYVDAPRPALAVLLPVLFVPLAVRGVGSTWKAVALALALTLPAVAASLHLAKVADEVANAEPADGGGAAEYDYGALR